MTATLEMVPVESSNVAAIGHDAAANELHVTFKGGATYVHFDVHRVFFHNMLAAKSKGQFYADHIKGVFKHRKL
jgi:hypothetical protein